MNPINIFFYILLSLIGREDNSIVSNKATITINPTDKTIEIFQENLYAMLMTPEDTTLVKNEIRQIFDMARDSMKVYENGITVEYVDLITNENQLDAKIKISYSDPKVLEDAGISFDEDRGFSMINIPDLEIDSPDAELKSNYWHWSSSKPVNFTMKTSNYISEGFKNNKRSMLPYWNLINKK